MRLRIAVLTALTLAATAGAALAQSKISIGPTGGFTLPFGDFGDLSNTGFHIGVTGDYELGGGFSLGGDIVWHRSTGKDDYEKDLTALNGQPTDVSYDIWPITVHGKYRLPLGSPVYRPFVRAGVGIYHIGTQIDPETIYGGDSSDNDFGVNFGGGFTFWSNAPLTLNAEAAVHIISTEGSSTDLLTLSATALFGMASK